jgi:alkyl hydroperoxide reductase subunit D
VDLETLASSLPDYAKDRKLNLSSVLRQAELTPQQTWGTAVCSVMVARNACLLETIEREACKHLTPEALLSGNPKYPTIPARLRVQVIRGHQERPGGFRTVVPGRFRH